MTRMVSRNAARAASAPLVQAASLSAASLAPVPPYGAADRPQEPSGHSSVLPPRVPPYAAGVSLKPQHYRMILEGDPDADFFEVHAENYFGAGGAPHRYLAAIRERFSLSVHGVGLSIGGAGPLNTDHLAQLRKLVDRYAPALVSEHLAWCEYAGTYFNDLLPVTLSEEALDVVCSHVDQAQNALGRQILIENPSSYLALEASTIPETAFLAEMVQRTGCGLLLDINNVAVSAHNLEFDAEDYLAGFPMQAVCEIHLAGHADDRRGEAHLKIDDHGCAPSPEVWALYERVIAQAGASPTLIEWDQNVPSLEVLLQHARTARAMMTGASGSREAAAGTRRGA